MNEWREKARSGVPGHEGRFVHATYDEWNGLDTHLRVSFRESGVYVIELDGISGWNSSVGEARRKPTRAGRELLRTGSTRGKGKPPGIPSLDAPSCERTLSAFRAELVLVAEFATLNTYRGVWTHPECPGFPARYVDEIWAFVEKVTGGAVVRFDRARWGAAPPLAPVDHAEPRALPCWPGQAYDGTRCTGRPSACPEGFEADDDGCRGCAGGRVAVDEAGHCCWPEQTWDGACRGAPACPAGSIPAEPDDCAREPEPDPPSSIFDF